MAKILLINPVIRAEDAPKHIPYGISLLASIAMQKGHQVQLYDANAWRHPKSVVEQVIAADDWQVIGIGGLTTSYSYIKDLVKICKRVNPKAFIILGGGVVTSMPLEMMTWLAEVDLGIVGEAFLTWSEVLSKIDQKNFDFRHTLGVCYRNPTGAPELTGVRPNIQDLDMLPYPAWDLLPLDIYFANSRTAYSEAAFTSKRRIDVNGSIGCSLICRYCWHLGIAGDMVIEKNEKGQNDVRFTYGRNIRYHSPEYIVKMVKTLVEKYAIDFCSFIDENMMTMDASSGRTWLFRLCDLWIKEGLQPDCRRRGVEHDESCRSGVHWSGTSHAGLALKETLDAMFQAGCSHLVYGIESFDPVILKKLGKGSSQKANYNAIRTCLACGIIPIPNIIIGFPEESFSSIRTTIEYLIKLGIHAKPHFATPYPGSEWYYHYKDEIMKQYRGNLEAFIEDLGDAQKITAVISHQFSAMELLGLQEIVAQRNLRLLDEAQRIHEAPRNWLSARESFNIIQKKVAAPLIEITSL